MLFGQQHLMNVGQHPTIRDGDPSEQLAELLVVPHRQLDVPRDDPVLLVVPRRVPSQFQNLTPNNNNNINKVSIKIEF